jgi:membrane associated rhomboid family serine protease
MPSGGGVSFPPLTPVVKWVLIVLGGIFLVQWILGLAAPEVEYVLVEWLGLNHGMWFDAPPYFPVWQLLTYGLLHGGFTHVLWNCLILYFFGTMVEGTVGSRRFAWFLAAGTIAGGVASVLLMEIVGATIPTIGASGAAVAATLAAATFHPRATMIFIFIPLPLWVFAVIVVARDFFPAVQILAGQGMPRVDHFAHIGGALFGFLAVRKNFIWVDWGGRVELALKRRRERALADDEQELDELLARVGREGIQSLSPRERDFLKRMSERKSKGGR